MSITMDKLVSDLQVLKQRKEEAMMNFHQVVGAIHILEQMIAEFVKKDQPDTEGKDDDEAHDESEE